MKNVVVIVVLGTILNFFAFVAGTFIVGGDAVNAASMCPSGKFYLWDKRLAQPCHEVSEAVYTSSKLHAYSVFISWPAATAGLIYLNRSKFLKWRKRGGAT